MLFKRRGLPPPSLVEWRCVIMQCFLVCSSRLVEQRGLSVRVRKHKASYCSLGLFFEKDLMLSSTRRVSTAQPPLGLVPFRNTIVRI